ncbi:DNA-directed RNA polymerase subunit alpha [Melbournevirus]|nr:DNA-directed RNA polymerase subunit alpha [Melbournevirus]
MFSDGWLKIKPTPRGDSVPFRTLLRGDKDGKPMSLKGNVQVMAGTKDDGDEMNMHVPQGDMEKAEMEEFLMTPHHIVSGQNNSPIIGLIQDALVGSFLMTKKETMVDWETFCDCCMSADIGSDNISFVWNTLKRAEKHYPEFLKDGRPIERKSYQPVCESKKWFDSKEEVVHHSRCKNKKKCRIEKQTTKSLPGRVLWSVLLPERFCYDKGDVHIEDGVILPESAPLTKSDLGPKAGRSIVHLLWLERSEQECADFMHKTQQLVHRWYTQRNLSIGTEDCQLTEHGKKEIEKEMASVRVRCKVEIESGKTGDDLESSITSILNSVVNFGQRLTKEHIAGGESNGFAIAIVSGAKGGFINLSQALAMVGQQNVEGGRIKMLISGERRCLPHFEYEKNGPEERGFISCSYYEGMSAIHAFFAAMGGREGIIDTAVKTADSGYLQRKIGHKIQSDTVNQLLVVTMCNGKVVEFIYGGDGMNASRLMNVGDGLSFVDPVRITRELSLREDKLQRLTKEDIDWILEPIKHNATPAMKRVAKNARRLLEKQLEGVEFACSKEKKAELRDKLERMFVKAIAPPGHSAGYEATCSIGEVQTQLTLNSFRLSGVGEKAVLTGVPKFRELMLASKSQKHSSATVCIESLNFEVGTDEEKREALRIVEEQRKVFEYRKVSDFVEKHELRYFFEREDEFNLGEHASEFTDQELLKYQPQWWVDFYLGMTKQTLAGYEEKGEDCVWVVELKVKKEMLYKYRMSLRELAIAITEGGDVACVPSPTCEMTLLVYPDYQRDVFGELTKIRADEKVSPIFSEQNVNFFFARDVVVPHILKKRACGVEGVGRIFPLHLKGKKKMMIDTEGSNFRQLLNTPGVVPEQTTSDDLHQVLGVLGIEAARSVLLKEFKKVMSGGSYVNDRHIRVLVNAITRDGKFTPASRDGVERSVGPLEIGSFEKMVDNLFTSAQFGELDEIKSIAASVFMGEAVLAGTATVSTIRADVKPVETENIGESLLESLVEDVASEIKKLFVLPCQ